jgi:hypothetical protein
MSRLDELPADQKAVLQLLLKQGKSYEDLGGLLRIDETAVRERALDALENLGPESPAGLNPSRQDEVGDYLLGQQSEAQAATTRAFLEGSEAGRTWARDLAEHLGPIARDPLPAIPDAAASNGTSGRPARAAGERSSRLGGLVVLGVVAVVVAVVLVALLTRDNGGGATPAAAPVAATGAAPADTTASTSTAAGTGQIESQVKLSSTSNPAIAVAYVLNRQGQRVLGIAGQKFPATANKFSYAVWLYTAPAQASRLGFVANGVGANGNLVTGADPTQAQGAEATRLKDQLARFYDYKQLIITRETSANATRPGPIVVAGPIQRPAAG